jgi:cysteine desulfurase
MGKAAEISNERLCSGEVMPLLTVRDYMIESIMKRIPGTKLNGSLISRLPNNVSFTFPGLNASQAVIALAGMGVYVSAGSACNNGDPAPSHVLLAIGRTEEEASQTLRFTLNHDTTMEDIDFAVDMLVNVVEFLTK